jgi:Uma2 family endonuclease
MSSLPDYYISPEQYLDFEREAETKNEYVDGQVVAMAGASERHNRLVANLIIALGSQLRGQSCRVYPSDLKVQMPGGRRYFYPDVSVICGPAEFVDEQQDVVTNPVVIIEVLSDATAAIDRGLKLQSYIQIPTLQDYLLVSQDTEMIERYSRGEDAPWLYTEHIGREAMIDLAAIGCHLGLADVFDEAT